MRVHGRHRTERGACLLRVTAYTTPPRNTRTVHLVRTQSCAPNTQRPSRGRALSQLHAQAVDTSVPADAQAGALTAATPQPRARGPRRLGDPSGRCPLQTQQLAVHLPVGHNEPRPLCPVP